MNNQDVEKGPKDTHNEDDLKKDLKKDLNDDLKKDPEGEEAAEDSPLKGKEMENDAGAPGGEKSGAKEGTKAWLSKSRVKWWIAILLAVVLLGVVLVGTLMAVDTSDYGVPDTAIRLVKLWPRPNKPRNVITFRHGTLPVEGRVWPDLTKQLDELLIRYQPSVNRSRKVVECFGGNPAMERNTVCKFDIRSLMLECSKTMNYGYDQGKPCIFLEFNNITHWIPEPYTSRELANYVQVSDRTAVSNMVYLDCQGDTLVDQENMGRIQYTPDRGFPIKYFPYKGHPQYMSPIVGIRFTNPAVGVAISVKCKLWAKNINHTEEAIPSGQIAFNLLVD